MDCCHCALDTRADLFVAGCLFGLASRDSAQTRGDFGEAHRDCRHASGDCCVDRKSSRSAGQDSGRTNRDHGRAVQISANSRNESRKVGVLNSLVQLHNSFKLLLSTLSEVQLSNYGHDMQMQDRVRASWHRMHEDLLPCTKAIHTSIHMSPKEREYFMGYVRDLANLSESSDVRKAIQNVNACDAKYKDFEEKMLAAAKASVSS